MKISERSDFACTVMSLQNNVANHQTYVQLKSAKNHTQMKVSERAAWVGVGYYEHGNFFGAAINSNSLRGASKFGIEMRHHGMILQNYCICILVVLFDVN